MSDVQRHVLSALEQSPLVGALAVGLAGALLVILALLVRLNHARTVEPTTPSTKATTISPASRASKGTQDPLDAIVDEHAAREAQGVPIDVTTLVAERPIGSGGQGGVWLAYDPTSGKRVALKQLCKGRLAALKKVSSVKPETCQWLIEREALLKCGVHPFVTTCHTTFQDDQSLFFALELASGGACRPAPPDARVHAHAHARRTYTHTNTACAPARLRAAPRFVRAPRYLPRSHEYEQRYPLTTCGLVARAGDLFSLLHTTESGQLPEGQCRFYTACVGLAIKHIHKMGFLYCDIKLENVLVNSDGYAKLCDFGLAKKLPAASGGARCCPSLLGGRSSGEARSYSKCGTDQYAPPEVVTGAGRAKGADWWALGVLLHEMLTGHSPFEGAGMAAIYARVEEYVSGGRDAQATLKAEVLEDNTDLSDAGAQFLIGLLTPDEKTRLGAGAGGFAKSVQPHAWFAGLDWAALLRGEVPPPFVPDQSITATDKKGMHAPTADEIRDDVLALFDPKRGVLRERPFEPSTWQHLFEPFGKSVPRVIKAPEARAASSESASSESRARAKASSSTGAPASSSNASSSDAGSVANASAGAADELASKSRPFSPARLSDGPAVSHEELAASMQKPRQRPSDESATETVSSARSSDDAEPQSKRSPDAPTRVSKLDV